MKIFLSKILYYIGHFISFFMMCDLFAFLYPLYNKVMRLSSELDNNGEVWKNINNE